MPSEGKGAAAGETGTYSAESCTFSTNWILWKVKETHTHMSTLLTGWLMERAPARRVTSQATNDLSQRA